MVKNNQNSIKITNSHIKFNIFKYVVHYARVYNYNDESYKWRPVIPIKKVYNSWIVIPLFTGKDYFINMPNYFLIKELSKNENVYIDLSRQDKILVDKKNFEKEPHKSNGKLKNIKKSTIKIIQHQQNLYLYGKDSLVKAYERQAMNKVLIKEFEEEKELEY